MKFISFLDDCLDFDLWFIKSKEDIINISRIIKGKKNNESLQIEQEDKLIRETFTSMFEKAHYYFLDDVLD